MKELKQRLDAGEDVFILDVREPYEYQIAQIGGKLIPQNDVPQRLAEIDSRPRSRRALPVRSTHSASPSSSSNPAIRTS